jgi:hypothetical protein
MPVPFPITFWRTGPGTGTSTKLWAVEDWITLANASTVQVITIGDGGGEITTLEIASSTFHQITDFIQAPVKSTLEPDGPTVQGISDLSTCSGMGTPQYVVRFSWSGTATGTHLTLEHSFDLFSWTIAATVPHTNLFVDDTWVAQAGTNYYRLFWSDVTGVPLSKKSPLSSVTLQNPCLPQ